MIIRQLIIRLILKVFKMFEFCVYCVCYYSIYNILLLSCLTVFMNSVQHFGPSDDVKCFIPVQFKFKNTSLITKTKLNLVVTYMNSNCKETWRCLGVGQHLPLWKTRHSAARVKVFGSRQPLNQGTTYQLADCKNSLN